MLPTRRCLQTKKLGGGGSHYCLPRGPKNQSHIGKYVNWEFAHPLYKIAKKYKLQEIKVMEINAKEINAI